MKPSSQCDRRCGRRRGAVLVESALVLGVFLTILLGSLDLSLAVLRENTLAEAARRLARAAIVHGEDGAAINTVWGPSEYSGAADESTEYSDAIRDILVVVEPSAVRFTLTWPDGGNASGDRVNVIVSSEYRPILTSLFGADAYRLQATSTMLIEH